MDEGRWKMPRVRVSVERERRVCDSEGRSSPCPPLLIPPGPPAGSEGNVVWNWRKSDERGFEGGKVNEVVVGVGVYANANGDVVCGNGRGNGGGREGEGRGRMMGNE